MSEKITLFTCQHRASYIPPLDFIQPVWAGRNGRDISGQVPGDDSGDHISQLNPYFSELTVIYWVWKNVSFDADDCWGLCHYRRYFAAPFTWFNYGRPMMHRKPEPKEIDRYINSKLKKAIVARMKGHDLILPELVNASLRRKQHISIEDQYTMNHPASDWQIMKEVLLEKYPDYEDSFHSFSKQTTMSLGNMMIAGPVVWNSYLTWLFDILFETHRRLPVNEDPYQRRAPGFMAERLLNLYVQHNKMSVASLPIVVFDRV